MEELAEQIAKARTGAASAEIESAEVELHAAGIVARRRARAGLLESELVVHLAFFSVGENVVGFLHLLELFFRGFIAGVQVGVVFPRELPVGLANLFLARLAGDAEHVVVILFGCRGH